MPESVCECVCVSACTRVNIRSDALTYDSDTCRIYLNLIQIRWNLNLVTLSQHKKWRFICKRKAMHLITLPMYITWAGVLLQQTANEAGELGVLFA